MSSGILVNDGTYDSQSKKRSYKIYVELFESISME